MIPISYVWNSFYENIISGVKSFYICREVPVDIIIVCIFFNFRLPSRKSQSQQTLAKKITHFTTQFYSKNLTHFTNLNSLDIENNMLPQHGQKPFWHVSVWCQKNIFVLYHFLTPWHTIFRHTCCINNPHWQISGILIFLCKHYIHWWALSWMCSIFCSL